VQAFVVALCFKINPSAFSALSAVQAFVVALCFKINPSAFSALSAVKVFSAIRKA